MPITINGVVYRNLEDQVAYLTEGYNDLAPISTYLPTDVSSINKLATNAYVDQAVTTVSAHYLTSNAAGDNFATKAALLAGPYYYGGVEHTPDENDYAFVNADEDHDNKPSRYVYIQESWQYQYSIGGVAGAVVDLTSNQTITGVKTFQNGVKTNIIQNNNYADIIVKNSVGSTVFNFGTGSGLATISYNFASSSGTDLGTSNKKWKDLYLSGTAHIGESLIWTNAYNGLTLNVGYSNEYTLYGGYAIIPTLLPSSNNSYDLGNNDQKWKDLYLSGNIIGSYREANNVAISSGFASGSFTITAADLNKAKHIEIYIHGPYAGNYFSMDVPIAAWNLSEFTSATTIKTGNMDYDEVNVIYSNGTLTLAISIGEVSPTPTVEMFLKFI